METTRRSWKSGRIPGLRRRLIPYVDSSTSSAVVDRLSELGAPVVGINVSNVHGIHLLQPQIRTLVESQRMAGDPGGEDPGEDEKLASSWFSRNIPS